MDENNTTNNAGNSAEPENSEQPKVFVNEKPIEQHQQEVKVAQAQQEAEPKTVVKPEPASTPVQDAVPTQQVEEQPVQAPAQVAPVKPVAKKPVATAPAKPEDQLTPEQKKELKAKRKKAKKKKQMIAGAITGGVVFVVIIVTIFLLLTQGGGSNNPLLQMFGISEENFFPFLIGLTNIIFSLTIFIAFLVGIIGLFKISMTKKKDKEGKKKSTMMAIAGGTAFAILAFAWTFTYMYLSSQQVETQQAQDTSIIATEPEDLTNLTAPQTITFDASGIPFNPYQYNIISYEWDFGDGSTATGVSVSHRFTEKGPDAGRYEVVLTVTYEDVETGEEAADEIILDVVFSNEQVAASFTADPENGEIPLTVTFDASESIDPDGEIIAYEWDLDGDGRYDDGDEVTAEYTYEQAGTYEVSLRVTDNNGEYNVATMEIEAGAADVMAVITSEDDEYYTGVEYTFSASSSTSENGDIESYLWDFGDGSADQKTRTAKHTFGEEGEYSITLEVEDENGESASTKLRIEVIGASEVPVAMISTDPGGNEEAGVIEGEVPLEVIFDASNSYDGDDNIVDYEWDFDEDGDTDDTGEKATYTFDETGAYIVTLTVIDADGNEDTQQVSVRVEAQALNATLTVSPTSGEVPLEVEFTAAGSSYPEGEIVAYTWDFGDGSEDYVSGAEVTYEYDTVGTFEASVTVLANDGSEDIETVSITVRPVSLSACFEMSLDEGPAPLIVAFDPTCTEGSAQSYVWDFDDGSKSYERKPTHTFEEVGVYTVELEVEDSSGVKDTYELEITVLGE